MPPFSSLFPQLPPPPPGASWLELQALEMARAQAAWAERSVWVQVAGLGAAVLAAVFAWRAASESRRQADAAQAELSLAAGARAAASRVSAWQMRRFLNDRFLGPVEESRKEHYDHMLLRLAHHSDDHLDSAGRPSIPWIQIGEEGFGLAAGINSTQVVPMWIALIDQVETLKRFSKILKEEVAIVSGEEYGPRTPVYGDTSSMFIDSYLQRIVPSWKDARAAYDTFWHMHRSLSSELDNIARGGNTLAASARIVVRATGTLS